MEVAKELIEGYAAEARTIYESTPRDIKILVGVAVAVGSLSMLMLRSSSPTKKGKKKGKKKKRTKKATVPVKLTPMQEMEQVVNHVKTELAPGCEAFVQSILEGTANKQVVKTEENRYRYNFYNEKLLEQLMKLDGIEGEGDIRSKRKESVKYIQSFHKLLDKVKTLI